MKRLVFALLLAPAIVLVCLFYLARFSLSSQLGPLPQMLVISAVPVALASVLLLGVPLAFLATRRAWLRLWHFAVGGLFISLPAVLATALSKPGGSVQVLNGPVVPSVALGVGVIAASLAWAIGVHGNASLQQRS